MAPRTAQFRAALALGIMVNRHYKDAEDEHPMINNNKILTVSYGTFSCTLEGFDDSFGTMKAIAEYFRDLSADDRYFGAEPAQPDAQMLARIAQREISRHVEAREDKGRIVLSAQDTAQAATLAPSQEAENLGNSDASESNEAPFIETAQIEEPPVEDAASEEPATVDVAELEAEEAPIVETVTDVAETQIPTAEFVAEIEQSQETAAQEEPALETEAPAEIESSVVDVEQDIVPSLPDAEVEAFFAESAASSEDTLEAEIVETSPVQDRATADSIADKLKRIRAVVSQQSDIVDEPDYSEDQHAVAAVKPANIMSPVAEFEEDFGADDVVQDGAEQTDVLADTLRDIEDALDTDDATQSDVEQDETPDTQTDSDEDIAAILNRLEQESDTDPAPESIAAFEDDDMDDDILAAMDSLIATPDEDDLDHLDDGILFDDEETAEVEIEAQAAPEPEAPKAAAPRARVLKVKRATLEAAIKSGKLEEYDDEEPEQETPYSLSEAAEAELARELADLEADMKAEASAKSETIIEDIVEETDTVADIAAKEQTAARPELHGDADTDLSRLMAETETQMDEEESTNRRDAFAHLRAAVAAKKADEAVGGSVEEEETDEAYRDDLASVVRPRRPVSSRGTRTERPAEQRPAPLKLVAEQRIDVSETKTATPVRPRRVAAVVNTPAQSHPDGATSFADFADEVGAEKLPDLLEAAAAYLSFVEGHEQFSRPQLMTKVRQIEKENFTREDSLRSFGKLLREGKIEKLKGGRFQASDQIGFKPDARAAS